MKNLLAIIICLLAFLKTQAQAPCEFDKVYNYLSQNSRGSKIIELKNGGYLVLGQTNFALGLGDSGYPQPLLIKTDVCGNASFIKSFENLQVSNSVTGIDLLELDNGRLVFASNYNYGTDAAKGITMLYLNLDGSIIVGHTFGDKTKTYFPEKLTQITANKFLLTGAVLTNKKRASAIIVDADGNVLLDSSYSADTSSVSYFTSIYVNKLNEIELFGVEDSSLFYVKIDTLGTLLNQQKISKAQAGFKSIDRVIVNEAGNNLIISGNNNQLLYLARLSKDMQMLNDITTKSTFFYSSYLKNLSNNLFAYSNVNYGTGYGHTEVLIIDSLFRPIWRDSIPFGGGGNSRSFFYDFIESANHSFLYLGSSSWNTGMNAGETLILKKKNTITFVTDLLIKGPNYIDIKNYSLQLETFITPANATKQQLVWSISDTNLASITQTGIVTAKKNGLVTVTATATDGSLIKATKTIGITNQTVGINELLATENQVILYPNPAQNQLTVVCNVAQIQAIHLLELSGKMLHTFTNNTTLNLSQCASGMYLVKIETDKGTVFKKLIISK